MFRVWTKDHASSKCVCVCEIDFCLLTPSTPGLAWKGPRLLSNEFLYLDQTRFAEVRPRFPITLPFAFFQRLMTDTESRRWIDSHHQPTPVWKLFFVSLLLPRVFDSSLKREEGGQVWHYHHHKHIFVTKVALKMASPSVVQGEPWWNAMTTLEKARSLSTGWSGWW